MTLVAEELIVKSRHRVKTYGEVFTPQALCVEKEDIISRLAARPAAFNERLWRLARRIRVAN